MQDNTQRDTDIDIEELKTNKEFLANLELLKDEMFEQKSLIKGYQLLDSLILIEAEEDRINEVFTFIVNEAFDKLATYLTTKKFFDMNIQEDISTIRAIYEHAIQTYSDNSTKSAKELFLVLNYVIDYPKLQDAMMVHAISVMNGTKFDDFMSNIADNSKYDESDPLAYFLTNFQVDINEFYKNNDKYIQKANNELKVLKEQ